MAIGLRGHSLKTGTGTATSTNAITGLAAGDSLTRCIRAAGASTTIGAPDAGTWEHVATIVSNNGASGGNTKMAIYVGISPDGTIPGASTLSASVNWSESVEANTGTFDAATLLKTFATDFGSGPPPEHAGITGLAGTEWAIGFICHDTSFRNINHVTLTERQDDVSNLARGTLADSNGAVGGATYGPFTHAYTADGNHWASVLLAIQGDAGGGGTAHTVTVTDGLGAGDAMGDAEAAARAQTDTAGLLDAIARVLAALRAQTDAAGLTDALVAFLGSAIERADTVALTDALARTLEALRAQADELGLSDSIAAFIGQALEQIDAMGATDTIATAAALARAVVEVLGITDAMTRAAAAGRSAVDVAGLTDALTATLTQAGVFGTVALSDAAVGGVTLVEAAVGGLTLSDAAVGGVTLSEEPV